MAHARMNAGLPPDVEDAIASLAEDIDAGYAYLDMAQTAANRKKAKAAIGRALATARMLEAKYIWGSVLK